MIDLLRCAAPAEPRRREILGAAPSFAVGRGPADRTYGGGGNAETPRRYLVVANLTAGGQGLSAKVQSCLRAGPCAFHLVVPASPDPTALTWTENEVRAAARERLHEGLSTLLALGAEADGEVGDWAPMMAIEDALRAQRFDEIIISTLPPGLSRWLRLDLVHRAAERFRLPVSHVISPKSGARAPASDRSRSGDAEGADDSEARTSRRREPAAAAQPWTSRELVPPR